MMIKNMVDLFDNNNFYIFEVMIKVFDYKYNVKIVFSICFLSYGIDKLIVLCFVADI
jgi:hypothetical protein